MKTIDEILKEEKEIRSAIAITKPMVNRLAFLKPCRLYLKRSPSEVYIRKELSDLKAKVAIINDRFAGWSALKSGDKEVLKRQYNRIYDLSKLRLQIKTLKYLID